MMFRKKAAPLLVQQISVGLQGMIYGNWVTPALSVPGNLIQVGAAMVIVLIVIVPLKKAVKEIFRFS